MVLMKVMEVIPVWLTLISSSPSEMCFKAASVPAVTVLVELLEGEEEDDEEDEELQGGPTAEEGQGAGRGGGGEQKGGCSSATDIILQKEKQVMRSETRPP